MHTGAGRPAKLPQHYLADFPVSHFMAQGFVGAVYQILGGKQEGHMTHD